MWIFLNNSFLSIVKDPARPNNLLVRARVKGDIERVFGRRKVRQIRGRDYKYRCSIRRDIVARTIAAELAGIDYGNFKDSVPNKARHDAYFKVWCAMADGAAAIERPSRLHQPKFNWPVQSPESYGDAPFFDRIYGDER